LSKDSYQQMIRDPRERCGCNERVNGDYCNAVDIEQL